MRRGGVGERIAQANDGLYRIAKFLGTIVSGTEEARDLGLVANVVLTILLAAGVGNTDHFTILVAMVEKSLRSGCKGKRVPGLSLDGGSRQGSRSIFNRSLEFGRQEAPDGS